MRTNYNLYYDRAIPGMREGSINFPRVSTYSAKKGAVKEVWTITIPASPTASTTYSVTLNNGLGTARYKTDASPTQAELQTGILNAIRTNPAFGTRGIAEVSSTNVIFTALNFGGENLLASASLTVAKTTAAVIPAAVPFGRFVARAVGETDPGVAGLPAATTDVVLGITHIVHDIEMTPSRFTGVSGLGTTYSVPDTMDVVDRTGESAGIWVECVESDITINDSVYVSVASGHKGKATKVSSGTIDVSSKAAFRHPPVVSSTGTLSVLIGFNVP